MAKVGRPPGTPKTGGRLKGTPNKNRAELISIAEKILGRAPLEELCHYYKSQGDEALALQALKEICSYCHPKLRAVEHTGKDGEPLTQSAAFTVDQLKSFVEDVKWKK